MPHNLFFKISKRNRNSYWYALILLFFNKLIDKTSQIVILLVWNIKQVKWVITCKLTSYVWTITRLDPTRTNPTCLFNELCTLDHGIHVINRMFLCQRILTQLLNGLYMSWADFFRISLTQFEHDISISAGRESALIPVYVLFVCSTRNCSANI